MGQRMGFPLPSGGGGGGSVNEVTSPDATINVTNPTGPIVDVSIANVVTAAGINITDNSAGGITIQEEGAGGLTLAAGANVGVILGVTQGLTLNGTDGGIYLIGLPTTDPMVAGELWNDNGTVVFSGSVAGGLTAGDFPQVYSQILLAGVNSQPVKSSQNTYLTSVPSLTATNGLVVTTLPTFIAPLSQVLAVGGCVGAVSGVNTTNDDLPIILTVVVSDMTGTNIIKVIAQSDIPQVGPGQNGSMDLSTGSATVLAGTDLSFDTVNGVQSAAGGIFMATCEFFTSWD